MDLFRTVNLSKAFLLMVLLSGFSGGLVYAYPPLQLYVEITPAGGTLKPPPGKYSGPVVIKKPITIEGGGKVEIDGGYSGTVLTIEADDSVVRGLHITNSGESHDSADAGVLITADNVLFEDNLLDEVLFGIHLKSANNNIVRNNTVSSIERDISIRGDGVRMWYSNDNLIENNILKRVRDIASNNSSGNKIIGNTMTDSRIGIELVYSPHSEVAENTFSNNVTGVVIIYSSDINIHGNTISHMRRLTGAGVSMKESTGVVVRNNEIAHCAVGLRANSPLDPMNKMTAEGNLFTYNVLGLYFYGEKGGHVIRNNRFDNNFTDVLGSGGAMTVKDNYWLGNQWDSYQGFDRDKDGIGDTPHDVYLYSERYWGGDDNLKFFRGSPAMGMLDFSMRLAPFKAPEKQFSDPKPIVSQH